MRRRNRLATTRRDPTSVRFIKSAIKGKKYSILMQLVAFSSIPEDAARDGMKAADIDD